MRNRLEIGGQIRVNHVRVAAAKQLVDLRDRVLGPTLRSIAIGLRFEISLEDRLNHQLGGGLDHAIPDCRDTEGSLTTSRLGDHHPPHRLRPVRFGAEALLDPSQPLVQPCGFDHRKRFAIHPRCPTIGFRQPIRMVQDVVAIDLVVQLVKAEGWFRLRLAIELSLKRPDLFWCCQAHCQSPHLVPIESMPEVRALSSTGITRRQRSYHPLRLPSWPPAKPTLRSRPSPRLGLPRLPEQPSLRAAPTTPTNQDRCLCRFPSRSRTAFPESQAGRRS